MWKRKNVRHHRRLNSLYQQNILLVSFLLGREAHLSRGTIVYCVMDAWHIELSSDVCMYNEYMYTFSVWNSIEHSLCLLSFYFSICCHHFSCRVVLHLRWENTSSCTLSHVLKIMRLTCFRVHRILRTSIFVVDCTDAT